MAVRNIFILLHVFSTSGNCHDIDMKAAEVSETYPTLSHRRLGAIQNDQLTFIPLARAEKNGLVGSLRVHTVLVDPRANATNATVNSCSAVGQIVDPCKSLRKDPCPVTCSAEHVITARKIDVVQKRLRWLRSFLSKTFRIKTAQSGVTVGSLATDNWPQANLGHQYDTDLVVIVTLQPAYASKVAGYAFCIQQDQYNRCTIGYFNWSPRTIDPGKSTMPNIIQNDRHTALHELLHVLGGIKVSKQFRHPRTGAPLPDSAIFVDETDPGYPSKVVRKIKTPRVLQLARQQFGCPSLTGVALEDSEMGVGSHWEARLLGPEILSYGINSGEPYLSSLTLAFFEDTNQYLVNYSMAGRLLEVSASTADSSSYKSIPFLPDASTAADSGSDPANAGNSTRLVHADTFPDGALRWGAGKGCAFVTGSAGDWGSEYTCKEEMQFGCTPDHLMSARCAIKRYGAEEPAHKKFSCGPGKGECKPNVQYPRLPSDYTYFNDDRGGFSGDMDYAPTKLGFWNCRDVRLSPRQTLQAAGDYAVDYGDLFDGARDRITQLGGQIHGGASRCFESSLVQISQVLTQYNPELPIYGLCFAANCASRDYLQFGIEGLTGVYWYGCPSEGGKVYIPGFLGSFHCPNATEFCSHPANARLLSGHTFEQTDPMLEFAFWGVVFGIPLLVVIVLSASRKARHFVSTRVGEWCGLIRLSKHSAPKGLTGHRMMSSRSLPEVTPPRARRYQSDQSDAHAKMKRKESYFNRYEKTWKSRLLFAINIVWGLLGLVGVLVATMLPLLVPAPGEGQLHWPVAALCSRLVLLSVGGVAVAALGMASAAFAGPSLKLICYFYIVSAGGGALAALMLLVTGVYTLSVDMSELILENLWFLFPYQWLALPADLAMMELYGWLEVHGWAVWLGLILVAISIALVLLSSVLLITVENLLGNFLFMFSLCSIVLGGYLVVVEGRLLAVLPPAARTVVFVAMLFPSAMVVIVGTLGIFTCGRPHIIIAFMTAASCLAAVLISFGAMVMCRHSLPQEWQARLDLTLSDSGLNASVIQVDDEHMADIAVALGARTTWSAQEISVMLEANQTAVGIALISIAVVIIVVVLPVSGWTLKLARARAAARDDDETERPRKFRIGKDWEVGVMTPLSPIPSDESELQQKSPPMLELVTVNDDADMSRYVSPQLPMRPRESPVRRVLRNKGLSRWPARRPPMPPGTPPTEDSVIFLREKNSSFSMSEDDWTPVHEGRKRVVH